MKSLTEEREEMLTKQHDMERKVQQLQRQLGKGESEGMSSNPVWTRRRCYSQLQLFSDLKFHKMWNLHSLPDSKDSFDLRKNCFGLCLWVGCPQKSNFCYIFNCFRNLLLVIKVISTSKL